MLFSLNAMCGYGLDALFHLHVHLLLGLHLLDDALRVDTALQRS